MKLTDTDRIAYIRARDEYMIQKIYSLYRDEFLMFMRKRLWKEKDLVLDVYQDSFMVMCSKIYENKLNEANLTSSLKTYLFGVGEMKARNINRKKDNLPSKDIDNFPDIEDDVDEGLGEENEKIIQEAVKEMGEPCHTILVKQYWERKSTEEIAMEMHYISRNAAKTMKYKCMQKLKGELKGKIVYQN
ncbi:MAG TPA: sigma-70 family RNA polymerase sigma factor [Paludibacter sp.]|jgi:RNA polymerase sigma-70 factor (ECF subfamily)|nr:sigma-70 family RNA polymerase sigma factor [Paludibacter sp.]